MEVRKRLALIIGRVMEFYLNWKYRHCDPNVCCCGGDMKGYCEFHYCLSLRDYTIERGLERQLKKMQLI